MYESEYNCDCAHFCDTLIGDRHECACQIKMDMDFCGESCAFAAYARQEGRKYGRPRKVPPTQMAC